MRKIALITLMAAAIGCGGDADSFDEPELVTVEQDTRSDNEMGFQTGLSDGSSVRCPAVPTGTTNCVLPPNQNISFRVTGTNMTATQKATVEGRVDDNITFWLDNTPGKRDVPSNWTLQRITSTADVNIEFGTLDQTNKNSINTYSRFVSFSTNPLDDQGHTGSWSTYNPVTCRIDNTKINVDFLTTQRPKVLAHAIQACMVPVIGVGRGGHVNRPHAIAVTPDSFKNNDFSNKSRCWLRNYVAGGTIHTPFEPALCAGETDN
jgi:hypothetical protein